jgi:hypothetical protein
MATLGGAGTKISLKIASTYTYADQPIFATST